MATPTGLAEASADQQLVGERYLLAFPGPRDDPQPRPRARDFCDRRRADLEEVSRQPVVMCSACLGRFGDTPPVGREPEPAPEPAPAVPTPLPTKPCSGERQTKRRPDRLRGALLRMPGSFSTTTAARAAGLNHGKTLARLHA